MTLRTRRGTEAQRLTITPLEGEPIYTTDTKKLYIGDGITVGGIEVTDAENLPFLPSTEALYKLNVDSSGDGTWVEDLLPDPTTGTATQIIEINSTTDGYRIVDKPSGGGGSSFSIAYCKSFNPSGTNSSTILGFNSFEIVDNDYAFVSNELIIATAGRYKISIEGRVGVSSQANSRTGTISLQLDTGSGYTNLFTQSANANNVDTGIFNHFEVEVIANTTSKLRLSLSSSTGDNTNTGLVQGNFLIEKI